MRGSGDAEPDQLFGGGFDLLQPYLEPGETIWAVVPGLAGDALAATDRRLFLQRGAGGTMRDWAFDELGDVTPVGDRAGQLPGRFLLDDVASGGTSISFAIDPDRREEAMQAMTIVQLLIARFHARRRLMRPPQPVRPPAPGARHLVGSPAEDPATPRPQESAARITQRWAAPTTRLRR
jgi:hypothetical protein